MTLLASRRLAMARMESLSEISLSSSVLERWGGGRSLLRASRLYSLSESGRGGGGGMFRLMFCICSCL